MLFTLPTEKQLCQHFVCGFSQKKTLAPPRSHCGAPISAISDEPSATPWGTNQIRMSLLSLLHDQRFRLSKASMCLLSSDQWIILENMIRIAGKKTWKNLMFIVDGYLMVTSCYASWKIYWDNMSEPWGNHGFSPVKVMEIPGFPSTNPKTETPPGLEGRRKCQYFLPGTTKTDSWYPIKSYYMSDPEIGLGPPVGQQHQRILWNVEAHHHHTNTPIGKICDTCWFLKFPITSQYMRFPTSWGVYIYIYFFLLAQTCSICMCFAQISSSKLFCCVSVYISSMYMFQLNNIGLSENGGWIPYVIFVGLETW